MQNYPMPDVVMTARGPSRQAKAPWHKRKKKHGRVRSRRIRQSRLREERTRLVTLLARRVEELSKGAMK